MTKEKLVLLEKKVALAKKLEHEIIRLKDGAAFTETWQQIHIRFPGSKSEPFQIRYGKTHAGDTTGLCCEEMFEEYVPVIRAFFKDLAVKALEKRTQQFAALEAESE